MTVGSASSGSSGPRPCDVGQRRADDALRARPPAAAEPALARGARPRRPGRRRARRSRRRWRSPTSVELGGLRSCRGPQGAGQAAGQPAGEQAGIDGAGDGRLDVDLGQHPDPGDVLDLPPAEGPPGLAHEDDAGRPGWRARWPAAARGSRGGCTSSDVSARASSGCQRRRRHAEVDARPTALLGERAGQQLDPAPGRWPAPRRRPAGSERGARAWPAALRCSSASASTPASADEPVPDAGSGSARAGRGRPGRHRRDRRGGRRRAPRPRAGPAQAATTVVPLPPLTDQQQVSTLTPEGRRPSRCRTVRQGLVDQVWGKERRNRSGCSRPAARLRADR